MWSSIKLEAERYNRLTRLWMGLRIKFHQLKEKELDSNHFLKLSSDWFEFCIERLINLLNRKKGQRIIKTLRPLIMDDVLNFLNKQYGVYYRVYWPYIAIALAFKFFLIALNRFFTCFIMLSFPCFCVINSSLFVSSLSF